MDDEGLFEEYGSCDDNTEVIDCAGCGEEFTLIEADLGDEDDIIGGQALVNAEERITDFRRWREVMDAGLTIEYRCVRCRSCNDCRNADQSGKVSLRQDAEDELIKESVKLDYVKKEIMATLPLRGKEEEFLASSCSNL